MCIQIKSLKDSKKVNSLAHSIPCSLQNSLICLALLHLPTRGNFSNVLRIIFKNTIDCSVQLLQSNISDSSTYICKPQTFGICISSFILVWMSVKKFSLKLKIDLNFKELLNQMSNSIRTFRKNQTFYFFSKK